MESLILIGDVDDVFAGVPDLLGKCAVSDSMGADRGMGGSFERGTHMGRSAGFG